MGSDSIDPELLRLPIPAPGFRLDSPVQFFLNALLEPGISQHPRFVGCFPDLRDAAFRDAVLE